MNSNRNYDFKYFARPEKSACAAGRSGSLLSPVSNSEVVNLEVLITFGPIEDRSAEGSPWNSRLFASGVWPFGRDMSRGMSSVSQRGAESRVWLLATMASTAGFYRRSVLKP